MPGITTALVVFILLGVALPAIIKSRTQFYCAVAFVAGIMLLSPFSFVVFIAFVIAILQMLAFIALVMCAGGLEIHEFANHMVDAYSAMRYGDQEKPVIVPRTGEARKEKTSETPVGPASIITPAPPPPPQEPIPVEPPPTDTGSGQP